LIEERKGNCECGSYLKFLDSISLNHELPVSIIASAPWVVMFKKLEVEVIITHGKP
jgi:hypothetical protein